MKLYLKLYVICLVMAACHPQLAAGYETTSHVSGPVTNIVTPIARAPITATDTPAPPPKSFSVWLGGGSRYASIDAGLHMHDIDSRVSMLATASIDLRITIPFYNHFAIGGHLGPAAGAVVDRTSGDHAFGEGVRFGGLVSVNAGSFGVFADVYETEMLFVGGSAQGVSKLTGLLVGVALR
ncbi:MAG: hypothetical protein JO257_04495 [Deltaproteobacteria bacterium]|nr:hypothetical protein [Deltaproteobacteria bacterium]